MSYSAKDIAKAFLEKPEAANMTDMTHMKVQKLVYFAQLVSVIYTGKPIHNDTTCAWDYGPVVPVLYHIIKRIGHRPVTLDEFNKISSGEPPTLDPQAQEIVNKVWNSFKFNSPKQLSMITHYKNTPWEVVYYKTRGGEISLETMARYKFGGE